MEARDMTVKYRGYSVGVFRASADNFLYYSIIRDSDGWEAACGATSASETIPEFIEVLKARIDSEHSTGDPWLESEDS